MITNAFAANGTLYGFGQNSDGQLGLAPSASVPTPAAITSLANYTVQFVAVGSDHSLVLLGLCYMLYYVILTSFLQTMGKCFHLASIVLVSWDDFLHQVIITLFQLDPGELITKQQLQSTLPLLVPMFLLVRVLVLLKRSADGSF